MALRRTLRVGKHWGGQPVEDLGVIPDVRYQMTKRDLLEGINAVTVPLSGRGAVALRLDGFDGGTLVGATTVPLG